MMHRSFNALSSICLRIDKVGTAILQKKNKWIEKLKPVARKIDENKMSIKFDEIGLPAFFEKHSELLRSSGFCGLPLQILSTFLEELKSFLPELINLKSSWTRPKYEIVSRGTLGCVVFIFGSKLVTATMKQLMAYTGFYVDKAKQDGELVGIKDCSLGMCSDRVMESLHKSWRQGKLLYSGGRSGPTGKRDYQVNVIKQQFINEWFRQETSQSKLLTARKLHFENDDNKSESTVIKLQYFLAV